MPRDRGTREVRLLSECGPSLSSSRGLERASATSSSERLERSRPSRKPQSRRRPGRWRSTLDSRPRHTQGANRSTASTSAVLAVCGHLDSRTQRSSRIPAHRRRLRSTATWPGRVKARRVPAIRISALGCTYSTAARVVATGLNASSSARTTSTFSCDIARAVSRRLRSRRERLARTAPRLREPRLRASPYSIRR